MRRRLPVEPADENFWRDAECTGWHGPAPAGELAVRRDRRAGGVILWLSGQLDQATSELVERELDLTSGRHSRWRLIDLTSVELIDAAGHRTLTEAQQHAREKGLQLFFRAGDVVGSLPQLVVTVPTSWHSDHAQSSDQESYFVRAKARAMSVTYAPM